SKVHDCPTGDLTVYFFYLTIPPPPRSTLFPYTTLFRSLLLHFLSLMLGSVLVLMLPLLVWLTPDLRIKKSLLKCNWTIRKRLPRCKMRLKKRLRLGKVTVADVLAAQPVTTDRKSGSAGM